MTPKMFTSASATCSSASLAANAGAAIAAGIAATAVVRTFCCAFVVVAACRSRASFVVSHPSLFPHTIIHDRSRIPRAKIRPVRVPDRSIDRASTRAFARTRVDVATTRDGSFVVARARSIVVVARRRRRSFVRRARRGRSSSSRRTSRSRAVVASVASRSHLGRDDALGRGSPRRGARRERDQSGVQREDGHGARECADRAIARRSLGGAGRTLIVFKARRVRVCMDVWGIYV